MAKNSLLASWKTQQRIIGALLMREVLTRYGRHNIGFLWLFVEPMMFTLGVTALWTMTQSLHGSSLPIVAFAITGYSSVLLWRNMPNRCIGAVGPNLALMYHRNVRVIDIYWARVLLEIAGVTMSFTVLSLLFIAIDWMAPPEDLLKIIGAWVMLSWFGFSVALLLGAWSEQSETVEKLWHPMSYLLFPMSGAAFLVDALPQVGQELVLMLPMVHGVELLREGYFGSQIEAHYDMGYMAICCAVLTLLGLAKRAHDQQLSGAGMIEARNLTKVYPTRHGPVTVLNNVCFSISKGEKIGILGRNGAGKSTLIRMLSGAERPTGGELFRNMSVSWPLAFGGAFQGSLTGADNLRFICRVYGVSWQDKLDYLNHFAELGRYLYEPVKTYSSGMRARLAFAISMVVEFDCFLIDEIIAVGDHRFHEKCQIELFEKRADRSMIIVSHDADFVAKHCDKAAVLLNKTLHCFDHTEQAYEFYHANPGN